MPIQEDLQLPPSAQELPVANGSADKLFVCFISSTDPATQQPWCPDVRAVLPFLQKQFSGHDAPRLAYVRVGQKPEWKAPDNVFRKQWNISGIPTLIRYQRIEGKVTDMGRLGEDDLVEGKKFSDFISTCKK